MTRALFILDALENVVVVADDGFWRKNEKAWKE